MAGGSRCHPNDPGADISQAADHGRRLYISTLLIYITLIKSVGHVVAGMGG
jgi:hypothetical protein